MNPIEVSRAVLDIRQCHGNASGFVSPATPIARDLSSRLVVALDGFATDVDKLDNVKIVTLCSIAYKNPTAAVRKLSDYLKNAPQTVPTTPQPLPAVPNPTPYDHSADIAALTSQITALYGRINALETEQPTVIQLGVHNAPQITLPHAHKAMPLLLHFLANKEHVFLVGEAGSGKTTGAEQAAEALGIQFYMSGKVEDETPLLGYILGKHLVRTPFREAYEHGGLFLIDEFCASNPNAVNAINAALANGYCAFPDGIVKRHANFICIAADNTDGSGPTARYPGRNVLDGASLDRFAMIDWDYDLDLERKLGAAQPQWTRYVQALRVMADNHAMGALITPRATIKGGMMLSAGMAWDDVATAYLWRKMSKDDARRLQAQVDDTEYRTQSNAAAIAA